MGLQGDRRRIDLDIARLLMGVLDRPDGASRAADAGDPTTVGRSHALNAAVRKASMAGSQWTDDLTWRFVESVLQAETDVRALQAAQDALGWSEKTHGLTSKTERRYIAVETLLGKRPKSDLFKLEEATLTRPAGPRGATFRSIVNAVFKILDASATEESLRELLPDSEPKTNESTPGPYAALFDEIANRLDEPVSYYPRHLTPTRLSNLLTISPIEKPDEWDVDSRELYSGHATVGGKPALEAMDTFRRLVLLGDPGSGKSTILAAKCVARLRQSPPKPTLYIPLHEIARAARDHAPRTDEEAIALVLDCCLSSLSIRMTDGRDELVADLCSNPDTHLMLDGLDEVAPGETKQLVIDTLRHLSRINGKIAIGSRYTGYVRPPSEWIELSVDGMEGQASNFMDDWFGTDASAAKSRAVEAISKNDHQELKRSPVLLGFVARVAENGNVPTRTSALYERYVNLYFKRAWKPLAAQRSSAHEIKQATAVARRAAWTTMEERGPTTTRRDITTLNELLDKLPEQAADIERMVEYDGLLVPNGLDDEPLLRPLRWMHRTVHEHLAGMYIADWWRRDQGGCHTFLERAVQSIPIWHVALSHFLDELSAMEERRVLEAFDEIVAVGDPGNRIRAGVYVICIDGIHDTILRRELAVGALEHGFVRSAGLLDPVIVRRHLLTSVRSGAPQNTHLITLVSGDYASIGDDEDFLRQILSAYRRSATSGRDMASCFGIVDRFKEFSEVEAIEAYLDLVQDVLPENATLYRPLSFSRVPLERFAEVYSKVSFCARLSISETLHASGVETRHWFDLIPEELLVEAQLFQQYLHGLDYQSGVCTELELKVENTLLVASLRGKYGSDLAYLLAQASATKLVPDTGLCVCASLGASPANKPTVWRGLNHLDVDGSFDPELFAKYVAAGKPIPARTLLQLRFAADRSYLRGSKEDIVALVELCALTSCRKPSPRTVAELSFEEEGLSHLAFQIVDYLKAFSTDSVVDALCATNPRNWELAWIAQSLMRDAEDREEHLVRIVNWAGTSLNFLEVLPQPADPGKFVNKLAPHVRELLLRDRRALGCICEWLESAGQLADWRNTLLSHAIG